MALGTNNRQAKPSEAPWATRKSLYTSHPSLFQIFYRHREKAILSSTIRETSDYIIEEES